MDVTLSVGEAMAISHPCGRIRPRIPAAMKESSSLNPSNVNMAIRIPALPSQIPACLEQVHAGESNARIGPVGAIRP
ncbi:hypothetical protein FHS51_001143 [Sphingobium wenxiniae]|uniref:hypothetical protein n=1 Tax=Sphingobium TaxID=165695 RepID=UPI0017E60B00|nr:MULTISPECIES: hypothetical protein [Sphingobium]MBB6190923.1 hypothetical protein [Sphingobium wenxiniae]WRD78404.1 hypothetical protein QQ987_12790 [Sphingobium baderi]